MMSFENTNPENRGASISLRSSRAIYPSLLQLPVRHQPCCSFCRQPGHNITRCTSDRLLEFEVICSDVVRNTDNTDDFKNWLRENYANQPTLLKAFVIRKYPVTLRVTPEHAITLITEYMFTTYRNSHQTNNNNNNNQTDLYGSTDMQYDLIHLFREIQHTNQNNENIAIEVERNYMIEILRIILANEQETHVVNLNQSEDIEVSHDTDTVFNSNDTCECSICLDEKPINRFVTFGCQHEFCNVCVIKTLQNSHSNNLSCALCRSKIQHIHTRTAEIKNEIELLL